MYKYYLKDIDPVDKVLYFQTGDKLYGIYLDEDDDWENLLLEQVFESLEDFLNWEDKKEVTLKWVKLNYPDKIFKHEIITKYKDRN